MPLYFAYGSNLLTARLLRRCPSARPLGAARLAGWRVAFAKPSSKDGSGKATVLVAAGATVEGALYDLPDADLALLDAIEGVGQGYDRAEVGLGDATAVTYVASAPRAGLRPFDWYLGLILAGAREHRLGAGTLAAFRAAAWDPDPDADRPTRQEAEALLTAAHGPDWRAALGLSRG